MAHTQNLPRTVHELQIMQNMMDAVTDGWVSACPAGLYNLFTDASNQQWCSFQACIASF